jgi:hypothetical protein
VADADRPRQRLFAQHGLEIAQLAGARRRSMRPPSSTATPALS